MKMSAGLRVVNSTFAAAACLLAVAPQTGHAELPPIIPREVLFGNPERVSPQLSPDGKRLAWIAPNTNNVLQVWVKTIGQGDDRVVTADKKRGIRQYFWAEDSQTVIYLQDIDGDENWHVYGVDLGSGNIRDYTAFQGVRAQVTATDPNFPDEMLLGHTCRRRQSCMPTSLTKRSAMRRISRDRSHLSARKMQVNTLRSDNSPMPNSTGPAY